MPCNILKNLPSGVTIHKLAEDFDTGDIILQEEIPLEQNENLESLTSKIQKTAPKVLSEFLKKPTELFDLAKRQGTGEYWAEPDDEDRTVMPSDSIKKANLLMRAFYGYGIIYKGETEVEVPFGEAVKEKSKEGEYLPLKDGFIRIKNT